jgi:hypothetical protein
VSAIAINLKPLFDEDRERVRNREIRRIRERIQYLKSGAPVDFPSLPMAWSRHSEDVKDFGRTSMIEALEWVLRSVFEVTP